MNPMEEILVPHTTNSSSSDNNNNNNNLSKPSSSFERRVKPQKAAAVNCPRCDSTNTKFCYYNNYSLSQPRYFCKSCRRYWTEGGTLRNIPVGGGSRKNKRSSSSSSSTTSSSSYSSKLPDLVIPTLSTAVRSQNPRIYHDQDLNLGFISSTNNFKNGSEFFQVPNFDATRNSGTRGSLVHWVCPTESAQLSSLEHLNGIATNSFVPISNSVYTPQGELMIPIPEFKIPSLGFSLDGMGSGVGGDGRILFPFEEVKTGTTSTSHDERQSKDVQNCDSNGFWNGMMGSGGSW